jgi:hypothetical protein
VLGSVEVLPVGRRRPTRLRGPLRLTRVALAGEGGGLQLSWEWLGDRGLGAGGDHCLVFVDGRLQPARALLPCHLLAPAPPQGASVCVRLVSPGAEGHLEELTTTVP